MDAEIKSMKDVVRGLMAALAQARPGDAACIEAVEAAKMTMGGTHGGGVNAVAALIDTAKTLVTLLVGGSGGGGIKDAPVQAGGTHGGGVNQA